MLNWAKKTLADVAGTEEPIYGPSAIRSVAEDAKTTPYTELTRNDQKWDVMTSTCVESQVFYFMSDNGYIAFAQVIYSNVAGIRTTCQFNLKIMYPDGSKEPLWSSTPLHHHEFSKDKTSFYATDCALELAEDGNSYTVKSMNDPQCIVNLKLTKTAPGFMAGKDGKTLFGTDLKHPWGSMRHALWPRCVTEGTVMTKDGPLDFKGKGMFVHALQGMKPHHAAARWNFVNFQGPTYSAVMMEFTTPPSYGATVVGVGGIAKEGELITAGAITSAKHLKTKQDGENDWPEPTDVRFAWSGTTKDGKPAEASFEGSLGPRMDRIDVMAEVPGFVKKIVAGAAGTKPYIYQFAPKDGVDLKMKIGDQEIVERGVLFTEATFISAIE
ncbi:oxidative stress survival, Svf1-like protein [Hypoxylon rubiginosum]|uniref:Oxidative stress survival, Svf1-like protein n=1 Tax=Hypoxylon rubiginosum TaxID=110542 RepID=A0ACC0CY10_9PEZI|nr:oxidative stress survival, Svf1-like protein [Hypoxylon rubiginosum]